MISERIYLHRNDKRAYLDTYAITDGRIKPRDAMLVIPGGGYGHVCLDREGECVALAYLARGINAFVLNYNVDEESLFPSQLLDAAAAMKHIKENAEKYHIDPNRIFAVGFSAGGHLAGTLAVHHNLAEKLMRLDKDYLKLAGVVLSYPVITAYEPTHKGSFEALAKKRFDDLTDEERRSYSIECNVNSETPPAFIWHTSADGAVLPHGSLKLAMAYRDAGIPFELHVFPNGDHGSALATEHTSAGEKTLVIPEASAWLDLSVAWINRSANT